MFQLSATPQSWSVVKDPKFGDNYFVLNFGKGDSTHVSAMVLHRLIGIDSNIDEENSWVMSKASDLEGFYATEKFPGASKCKKALNEYLLDKAVKTGLFKKDEQDVYRYPDGTNRNEVIEMARESSKIHSDVPGHRHLGEWLLYLPPQYVEAEVKFAGIGVGDAEYGKLKLSTLSEWAVFNTSLFDGTRQKEVPYLYGVAAQDVLSHLYTVMMTGNHTGNQAVQKDDQFGILPFKLYSSYKVGDDSMRQQLVKDLAAFAIAKKAKNLAKANLGQNKDKSKISTLKEEMKDAEAAMAEAIETIRETEQSGKYPSVRVDRRFELSLPRKMTKAEILAHMGKVKAQVPPK
jgi:hypothetical protein